MNILLAKNNTGEIEQLLNLYTFTPFFQMFWRVYLTNKANKDIDPLKRVIYDNFRDNQKYCAKLKKIIIS